MASRDLTDELQCPICLDLFTDPVTLDCDHTLCRPCIEDYLLNQGKMCPECRAPITGGDFKTSRVLKNLADKARQLKQAEKKPEAGQAEATCTLHDEKLKLFCETDDMLICVICRDASEHQGHTFKPLAEALQSRQEELNVALQFLMRDNKAVRQLENNQNREIAKTKDRSGCLLADITAQFAELHEFLHRREKEVKRDLKTAERRALEPMERNLQKIQRELGDGTEQARKLQDSHSITQPVAYLKWWSETGAPLVRELKNKPPRNAAAELEEQEKQTAWFQSKVKALSVVPDSLWLGPYETHLQFFIWKQMLTVIKTVPDRLSLETQSSALRLSKDRSSVRQVDRQNQQESREEGYNSYMCAISKEQLTSGRHYWEVEVGAKTDWAVGVKQERKPDTHLFGRLEFFFNRVRGIILHFNGNTNYRIEASSDSTISVHSHPSKIGVYLDRKRGEVAFYNADDMSLIHTVTEKLTEPVFAYLNPGPYLKGNNAEALKICRY
ncbi:nuclear factor 7, brain-like [Polyodon spathula]|uniref:nuclear factor 7, brain-like n=1 Tax=Polyodon spathula TaxID=7913 RepID=UPI001B7DD5F1|nr:nuclear factor 7, brain-like [Polyodon spathula]